MTTDSVPRPSAIAPAEPSVFRADLVAGLTTALVLVPQSMGYALLAGLPPIAGLHAATLGLVAYALLGSTPALAVGPVAMDSLLTAAALAGLGLASDGDKLAAAGLLAVMVGLAQLAMGALRLGHLTNFLSNPVVSGFTTAAAMLILMTQVSALLGLPATSAGEMIPLVRHVVSNLPRALPAAVFVGLGSVAALLFLEKRWPTIPRAPIVLTAATLLVQAVPALSGIARVGTLPIALPGPHLRMPDASTLEHLAPHALTIAFVAFLEAYSVAKRYADLCGEPKPSRELAALGAANLASAASGGFPITGGLSRSAVLMRAGAKTKRAGIVTAIAVLLSALVLAPLLAAIPKAALAAVVATSVASLIDRPAMRRIFQVKPIDGLWMLVSFAITLVAGFQWGIAAGVLVSVGAFLFESTRPHVAVLGRIPGTTTYRNVLRYEEAEQVPGMLLVRIDSQLYFGNATFLRETMAELEQEAKQAITAIVLDASGVNQLDSSAEGALSRLLDDYEKRGIVFALASVKGPVRDVMKRSGLWKRFGRGRLFLDVHAAVTSLRPPAPTQEIARALSPAI